MGELKTLSELKSHIVYMRKHKFVLHLSKIWASKQPLAGQSLKNYGVTFKLVRCEIQSRPIKKQIVTDDKNPFIDSDDDDDDDDNVEKDDNKETKHFVENDESESEEESEEKPATKSKKRTVKKNA